MKLYLSKGRHWTGTQADAKAAQGGTDYETIEVPDAKPDRIKWLNEQWATMLDGKPNTVEIVTMGGETKSLVIPEVEPVAEAPAEVDPAKMRPAQMERFEALARKMGWTPPGTAPVSVEPSIDAIEDVIETAVGNPLIRILSSAVSRLGTVAGTRGWAAFAKDTYAWSPGAKTIEQGMGMLMLSAFKNFGADEKPTTAD